MTVERILTEVISALGVALVSVWWLAPKIVQRVIDTMKEKEVAGFKADLTQQLEKFKAQATRELESVKHELQLEHTKQSIVYDSQKLAFGAVIKALNDALLAIEETWDYGAEEFGTLKSSVVQAYYRAIEEHCLFVPKDGYYILQLFGKVMQDAVGDTPESSPCGKDVRNVYETLGYVRAGLVEYFQKSVGLLAGDNPLLGPYYLGACRRISTFNSPKSNWPTPTHLRLDPNCTPAESVDVTRADHAILVSELKRFISDLRKDAGRATVFYDTMIEAL